MWDPVSALALLGELVAQVSEDRTNEGPYVGLLIFGFLVGAWGHAAKSRWLVAFGILLVIGGVVGFQFEIRETSPDDLPPGV